MLQQRSADTIRCLRQAEECEELAFRAIDPSAKRAFFDVAARWRLIAETCEYIERVDSFLGKRPKG